MHSVKPDSTSCQCVSADPRWQMVSLWLGNPASGRPHAIASPKCPAPNIPKVEVPRKTICHHVHQHYQQLSKKHLVVHGMSPKEYKKKYGFPMMTRLAAKSLTKARSKAAQKRGLPENLRKAIEARRQKKAQASTKAPTETERRTIWQMSSKNRRQGDKMHCEPSLYRKTLEH